MPGAKIRVIRESQPLGTGGALRGEGAHLDDLLMTNGDSALMWRVTPIFSTSDCPNPWIRPAGMAPG